MGRKSKKKRIPTRPRTEAAYFRTGPDTTRIEVTVDRMTGRVTPGMKCETAYTAVTYERENTAKADKVVNRMFSLSGEPALDADGAFREFEVRVAIDTNTWETYGRRRSVVGIVIADNVGYGVPYCIEVADLPLGWEERAGWAMALGQLLQDGFLEFDKSTVIVVDAHLDQLDAINRRAQDIVEGLYLPPGWMMSYASADAGADFEANRLLRGADRAATQVLERLASTSTPLMAASSGGALAGPQRVISGANSFKSWGELHERVRAKKTSRA